MLKNNPYNKAYLNIINESVNVEKYQQIADQIGGEYIVDINTIDCMGNRIHFKDNWLDENGTFNFKLINTSNDWSMVFCDCTSLKYLPDNFTIPEGVTNCRGMFMGCKLTHLPNSFTIPQGVTDCHCMFMDCESLTHLPESFTVPQSVIYCSSMFQRCESLKHLPDSFTIPQGVTDCSWMFRHCTSLTRLPNNFTLPQSVADCSWMFSYCESLTHLSNSFKIPIDCYCDDIFFGCDKLDVRDPEEYKQWEL